MNLRVPRVVLRVCGGGGLRLIPLGEVNSTGKAARASLICNSLVLKGLERGVLLREVREGVCGTAVCSAL